MDEDQSVMIGLVTLMYGLVAMLLTINALRRPAPPTHRLPPVWILGLITSELAPLVVLVRVIAAGGFIWAGALEGRRGRLGLWLIAASIVLMVPLFIRLARAARQAGSNGPLPARSLKERFTWKAARPDHIELTTGIPYTDGLTLDVYRNPGLSGAAPAFVYVHGGSWTGGDPHRQSRSLFHHLAESGWLVIPIRYPLSPGATFPEHIIGVKRAIAFLRGPGGRELGVDPDRLVLAGGSAGGHLAALVALTAHRRDLQPGFESVDTSVAGCVTFYGVYDFLIRNDTRPDWPVIPKAVMKATADEAPDLYRLASPIDQVHPDAPPFLVIHGTHDSLVPPREAAVFVEKLASLSESPVEHVEVIGAQHGFDAISSVRTRAVASRVAEFLGVVVPADSTA